MTYAELASTALVVVFGVALITITRSCWVRVSALANRPETGAAAEPSWSK